MGQDHSSTSGLIVIGSIGAPFGINGWLKVNSYTDPKTNIFRFKNWYFVDNQYDNIAEKFPISILDTKKSTDKLLVLLTGIEDRTKAATFTNKKIAIERNNLPKLAKNQYYWADLIDCSVYNLSNKFLGVVDHMFATAANEVMVVQMKDTEIDKSIGNSSQYLIPYKIGEFIVTIDLTTKKIIVNWDV